MMQGVEYSREGVSDSKDLAAEAVSHFMKTFVGLCRSHEDVARLKVMADEIVGRWGGYGCDMVSAFPDKYWNLDLARLKKAVLAFVNSSSQDIQNAIEEFWWLMGLGGYEDLLADELRFEVFRRLMEEQGLECCQKRAALIRDRINAVTGGSG